jgi:hypothetical protein
VGIAIDLIGQIIGEAILGQVVSFGLIEGRKLPAHVIVHPTGTIGGLFVVGGVFHVPFSGRFQIQGDSCG